MCEACQVVWPTWCAISELILVAVVAMVIGVVIGVWVERHVR